MGGIKIGDLRVGEVPDLNPDRYMAESGGINARLFNPFSAFSRSGVDKYPEFFAHLAPNSARAGWLAAKVSAAALLGAALFGVARGVQGLADAAAEERESDPAKKMRKQVGTTFSYGGEKKNASVKVERPGMLNVVDNAVDVAAPALALLLSGLGVYKAVDKAADKIWTAKTDKSLAANDAMVRRLVETRARLASGKASDQEVEDTLAAAEGRGYVKSASDNRPSTMVANLATAIGLLTAGAGLLTGIGAYKYFKESNPDNIRYKAMKRGLSEFARLKAEGTPITVSADPEMLARIDAGKDEEEGDGAVREQPEAEATRKPLKLTLD